MWSNLEDYREISTLKYEFGNFATSVTCLKDW